MSALFTKLASAIAHAAGRPLTFVMCCALIIIWAVSGPIFGFSDTWQLIINTSTTIITFLMVFLIQNTQNRDSLAVQAKLDELISSSQAMNAFIGIEHLPEEEVQKFKELNEHGHEAEQARAEAAQSKKTQIEKARTDKARGANGG